MTQGEEDRAALRAIIADPRVEALVNLAEECSEVIKEVCKMQRFGVEHVGPTAGGEPALPARVLLSREAGNLYRMILVLERAGVIDMAEFEFGAAEKAAKLRRWSNIPEAWLP